MAVNQDLGTDDVQNDTNHGDSGAAGSAADPREAFIARMEKNFAKADRDEVDREDGVEGAEDGDDGEGDADDDDSDDSSDESEHSDEDTDGDRDDDADESDEDSDADDDTDTDEADDESDDDESDDDAGDDEDEEDDANADDEDEGDVSEGTKAALTRHGATLTLDDVPEKYRGVVEQKLKRIDASFTRAMQEATAFRTEQRAARAETKFRQENPEYVIVEMLRKDPDLFTKANKLLSGMDPNAEGATEDSVKDAESVFDERIERRRELAQKKVEADEVAFTARTQRAQQVEDTARTITKKLGVPFNLTVQKLIAAEITAKPDDKRGEGLSEDEITTIVKVYARDHRNSTRATVREDRKKQVQDRTSRRQAPARSVRRPSGTASPGTSGERKTKVDHNDPEARLSAGMRAAKKIMPGRK